MRVLVKLRNEIDAHTFKNGYLVSRFFIHTKTLSYPTRLHQSTISPEPSLITFVINTSRYGFIMLGSSDSKKKVTLGHIYDTERPERLNDHRHVGHCVHARVVVYELIQDLPEALLLSVINIC